MLRAVANYGAYAPTSDYNFTNGSLPSGVTFTRGSTGLYTASTGILATAAVDAPRFDYNPVTSALRGLLLEESRTNTQLNTVDMTTGWTGNNASASIVDSTLSPAGSTALKLKDTNTVSGGHFLNQAITYTAATWTISCYVKAAEYSWFYILNQSARTWFNVSAGTVGTIGAGMTPTITPAGNGWYRCEVYFTATASSGNCSCAMTPTDNTFSWTGVTGSGGYIYGFQAELGQGATSYIPTTSSTVTRAADVATISSFTAFKNYMGTIYGEGIVPTTTRGSAATLASFNDNSTSNRLSLRAATTAAFSFVDDSGGASQLNATEGTLTASSTFKLAHAYQTGQLTRAVNGGMTGVTAAYTAATGINQITLGTEPSGNYLNGWLRKVQYYDYALTPQQLKQLTT